MLFQKIIISVSILTLSSLPSFGDLIAGLKFGDSRETVENKLNKSPLADANITKNLFGRTGLNGAFKTTKKLDNLQYSIFYDWDNNDKLKHLNLHSESIPGPEFKGQLKESWSYLTNFLSSIHGKAQNAANYPSKNQVAMDAIYFTHEWKTDTGYLYMGPGLNKNGYTLVMTFTKTPLTSSE